MPLQRLLLAGARRAVFGSAAPALRGLLGIQPLQFSTICGQIDTSTQSTHTAQSSETAMERTTDSTRVGKSLRKGLNSIKGNWHNFCTAVYKDVTYKELKNLLNSKKIMLIDVRNTWEIIECGKIPGSVNIPSGMRSKKALDIAISLGFTRSQHYAGGWKEWSTYEHSEKKQGN
ncbi:PREDICTED: thiosulfate sulfurtransferase/rhodanese-like domain-containing protein 3 isoform X2 [Myotis brandtii]|uniref:thiosulfate sulfurtransferase/rhodanese-like domain-containing protein 3 isoform X2 n=1 Tax=Myotis brandtii TaxID=109478 RepID=UPI0007047361|nr:PREDICTED: thiosulfate sulfurtransferase/rhodanese-like domain-containing protein 3 isoform X2 [Myotis brandtii]